MAANTDKLRKKKSLFSTTLNGAINDSDTTIALSSASGLPTDTAITLTIDRVDANGASTPSLRERVTGVISSNNLTNSLRGQDGSSAQAHASGAVVEDIWEAETWNDLIDALIAEHDQDGTHGAITPTSVTSAGNVKGANLAVAASGELLDNSGNELLGFTQTASAVNELTVANAATGNDPVISATGGDTDVGIKLTPKGAGKVQITANDLSIPSTGNIQPNGSDPWRTLDIVPGFLKPATTSGCAASATVEAGTNDIDYDVLDFDKASDENAFANIQMPDSWDGGVIQFRFIWTSAGGSASETVVFELSGRSFANDDAIDQAVGTPVEVSDALIATGDIHISSWSSDVTLAGGPAAGEWVHLEIMRDVSEDNLDSDARLIGIQIRFKQAQYGD